MSNVSMIDGHIDEPRKTHYDRIRNMSVEEMAEFLMNWFMRCALGDAPLNVKEWLESEVD